MFDVNIRAIIPQIAMSAGTMIACACREILMGKQSSLGPIDPQIGGLAAHGVIEEFTNAQKEVLKNQVLGILW
jgi:ClpP class serine protease